MASHFTYSLLQYKHSILLKEALNVGIVFHFPAEAGRPAFVKFVYGNTLRLKAVYPEFDNGLFTAYLRTIEKKITQSADLFQSQRLDSGLALFLDSHVLARDASAFQFADPVAVTDTYADREETIDAYSRLLLPGIAHKPLATRKTDAQIIQTYRVLLFQLDKRATDKLIKRPKVGKDDTAVQFEYAWQNGSCNYIKPLSFDYKEKTEIDNKAFLTAGQLKYLAKVVEPGKVRFDYIVAAPSDRTLHGAFAQALQIIADTPAPFRIVREEDLPRYSAETVEALNTH